MQGNINIPDSTITTNLSFRQLVLMNMQQLTNFPYIEKDFDALTDYELLCLVVKFLNDVIANQNEQNASITRMYESFLALQDYVNNTKDEIEDAFNNLDDYVRNYFDNLDVQEEINNKLDQMLEDGVLEQIIEQFLQSTALWAFDNVANMKNASNLINGSFVRTLGFYNKNDGGGAFYKIRTITSDDVIDEKKIISLINNSNLIAELIIDDIINVLQYGVRNNGINDTISDIQYVIDNNPNKEIFFPDGTYLVSDTIYTPADNTKSVSLKLSDYAVIKASDNFNSNDDYLLMIGGKEQNNYTRYSIGSSYGINGGIIDCNNKTNGVEYSYGVGGFIKNTEIRNATIGLNIPHGTNNGSNDLNVDNIDIYGDDSISSIGMNIIGNDNLFRNVRTFKTRTGVKITGGGNHLTNIHCLLSTTDYSTYNDSIGFDIDAWNNTFDFCYSDQFSIAFYVKNSKRNVFRSAWAYYYQGGDYNHTAFKCNGNFSPIIDDLYVNFASNEGTNKVLDITTAGGSGKLTNLRINNQTYLTNVKEDCFLPYYNKDFIKLFTSDLSDIAGTINQFNSSAENNMISLNMRITGIAITANTNTLICKLPNGFYNKNADVNITANLASVSTGYKFNCWIDHTTGNLYLTANQNVNSAANILINACYHIN